MTTPTAAVPTGAAIGCSGWSASASALRSTGFSWRIESGGDGPPAGLRGAGDCVAGRVSGGRLSVGLRALGGRHGGRRDHAGLRPRTSCAPFRYHHVDPSDITPPRFRRDQRQQLHRGGPHPSGLPDVDDVPNSTTGAYYYCTVVVAFTSWFVFCTNQFHKWAHNDEAAGWIRALQRMGLILLAQEHHALHHASPQNRSYCITVGWMNPLDSTGRRVLPHPRGGQAAHQPERAPSRLSRQAARQPQTPRAASAIPSWPSQYTPSVQRRRCGIGR